MSEFTITEADVEATTEFIAAVATHVETVDVDEAVTFRHLLEQHKKIVALTISLIDSTLIQRLESPQIREGVEYRVGQKKESVRYDHDRILSSLAKRCGADEETGEVLSAEEQVAGLLTAVKAMYLSPSTKAKAGGLKRYGIDRGAVETAEWGGEQVYVTAVEFTNGGTT